MYGTTTIYMNMVSKNVRILCGAQSYSCLQHRWLDVQTARRVAMPSHRVVMWSLVYIIWGFDYNIYSINKHWFRLNRNNN